MSVGKEGLKKRDSAQLVFQFVLLSLKEIFSRGEDMLKL